MPASTLVCLVMNSAACAYATDVKTKKFVSPQPYYDATGYQAMPIPISGGLDTINAVLLVGTTEDGVVVACRGTLAPAANLPSILNWIQDVFLSTPKTVVGLSGKVHSGFYMATQSIWRLLLQAVQQQMTAGWTRTKLYMTGHSKGVVWQVFWRYCQIMNPVCHARSIYLCFIKAG